VSNILFPEVQVSMAPCERKKKISTFFTSLFPIEWGKNCPCADEFIWFVSRGNEKDDAFSHQKLMFTI